MDSYCTVKYDSRLGDLVQDPRPRSAGADTSRQIAVLIKTEMFQSTRDEIQLSYKCEKLKFEPKTPKHEVAIPHHLLFTYECSQRALTKYDQSSSLKNHCKRKKKLLYTSRIGLARFIELIWK